MNYEDNMIIIPLNGITYKSNDTCSGVCNKCEKKVNGTFYYRSGELTLFCNTCHSILGHLHGNNTYDKKVSRG